MLQKKENIKQYQNEDTEISVNEEWCKACGICIHYCPKNVLVADDQGHPVAEKIDDCIQCMLCELRCPDFAIRVVSRKKVGATDLKNGSLED